jgi:hypothetical protein
MNTAVIATMYGYYIPYRSYWSELSLQQTAFEHLFHLVEIRLLNSRMIRDPARQYSVIEESH